MTSAMNRRTFVRQSVLASAGAALAANCLAQPARAADPGSAPATPSAAAEMPCGRIKDLVISRLLLGGNLLTHFTHSRDLRYVYALAKHYNTPEKILETLAVAEAHGINTLVVHYVPNTIEVLKKYREQGGKMQWITCTCHALVSGGLEKFADEASKLVDAGTDALYISGVEADVTCGFTNDMASTDANKRMAEPNLDLIAKALDLAKAHLLPVGLGAHRLGPIQDCENAGLDIDFYLKTFHHHDYASANLHCDSNFCPAPEEVSAFMQTVKKPFIAYKVMAAGAIPPEDAFRYVLTHGADFVLAGMFDFEIAEDARLVREILPSVERQRPWQA